jgi:hypothetical protein
LVEGEDVKVTDPPEQNTVAPPAVIIGVAGSGFVVTVLALEVRLQPLAPVMVTVYEPLVPTLIDGVFAPVDHKYPVAAEEVKLTDPPSQNVVEPLVEMLGTKGNGFTTVVTEADA